MSMRNSPLAFGLAILVVVASQSAFADDSSITIPILGGKPIIDGVWTSPQEWSQASLTSANYTDGTQLVIKAKHDWNSLYVLLEMPDDYVSDGHGAICLDILNDGGPYMNSDDYCFVLGSSLKAYRGDERTTIMKNEFPINQETEGARGLSGSNSPYGSRDHMSYEFKVPLKEYGQLATQYGVYITYDTRGQKDNYQHYYSWPDFDTASYLDAPSPRSWGKISLAADADVPEFPIPLVSAVAGAVGIMVQFTLRILFKSTG